MAPIESDRSSRMVGYTPLTSATGKVLRLSTSLVMMKLSILQCAEKLELVLSTGPKT